MTYLDQFFKQQLPDADPEETQEWLESLDAVVEQGGRQRAQYLLFKLLKRARMLEVGIPPTVQTRYINTISPELEPAFPGDEDLAGVMETLGDDLIVKPNAEGSTVGLSRVHTRDEFHAAVELAARYGKEIIVEKFIPGRELTVAVLGEEALPVVEIVPAPVSGSPTSMVTSPQPQTIVPQFSPTQGTPSMQSFVAPP